MLPDFPVRQRDFLLEISRAITAQLDLSEVLRRVLHASVVMSAGRVGLVALKNSVDDRFYVQALAGIPQEMIPAINEKLHEMVTGAAAGVQADYFNAKLSEMANIIDTGLQQSVAMPLSFAEQPLGLLIVFRSYQAQVTDNDVQILQSFADQAAIAVHNAQLYERINEERMRLAAILDHSGDGVMILDANLDILRVNQAFERIVGWSAEDAVGLNQDDVIIWKTLEQRDLRDAINAGWPRRADQRGHGDTLVVEGDIQRPDGLRASIGIIYAPLVDGEGQLVSVIANIRDITNFRRAQEMQNIFISTISHELRTPVALIKGYAGTLRRDDAQWDLNIIRQSLNVIEDEADRLTDLIEDLLTASKIQAQRDISLTLGDVRLDLLAARSVERLSTQTRQHTLELSFPEAFPVIQGDNTRLRQVIDNLITNAIKYSPEGGTITVGGRFTEHNVTLFVRDEGEGIPEHEQTHIFDRFYRVDNNLSRKTKGTGLGLYLVKVIIEAHEGRIAVKSQPGHGATFYFNLPRD